MFQTAPVRRVFKVVNGGTPDSNEGNWGGEIEWATPADFGAHFSSLSSTRRRITPAGLRNGSTLVPRGTILLSTRAPIGYVTLTSHETAFNQGCRALLPHLEADARFYGYQLEARRDELQAHGLGTTFVELSSDSLAAFPLYTCQVEHQRRIADFLDAETSRMDRLASSREKQLSLLWERLESSAMEATGRSALHADPGRPSTKLARALVMIRTGTTPSHLEDTSEKPSANTLPWYTPAALDGALQVNLAEKRARNDGNVPVFPAGSILITGIGESLGKVGYLTHAATGNQQLTALFPTQTSNGRFIAWQLWAAQDEIRNWAQYSRVRIINNDTLANFQISLPDKDIQDHVAASLDQDLVTMRSLQAVTDKFLFSIRERRQALITAAVTGQFDVSTASGRGVTE